MFVSSGVIGGEHNSLYRVDAKCEMRRNGSFIDIHYTEPFTDKSKWIGVSLNELKDMIETGAEWHNGVVTIDIPAEDYRDIHQERKTWPID